MAAVSAKSVETLLVMVVGGVVKLLAKVGSRSETFGIDVTGGAAMLSFGAEVFRR